MGVFTIETPGTSESLFSAQEEVAGASTVCRSASRPFLSARRWIGSSVIVRAPFIRWRQSVQFTGCSCRLVGPLFSPSDPMDRSVHWSGPTHLAPAILILPKGEIADSYEPHLSHGKDNSCISTVSSPRAKSGRFSHEMGSELPNNGIAPFCLSF